MEMKLTAAALTALFFASSASAAIEGESSTVRFTGEITQATCSLATDSIDKPVELGSVASSTFHRQGDVSTSRDFAINLIECDTEVAKKVSLTFHGDTASDTALNTSAVATTKVGIQILQDGAPLTLDGSTPTTPQTLTDGDNNSLPFAARYVALDDNVAAGEANATAFFTLHYE